MPTGAPTKLVQGEHDQEMGYDLLRQEDTDRYLLFMLLDPGVGTNWMQDRSHSNR